jgi:hypothetical protein
MFSDEGKVTDNLKRFDEIIEGNNAILEHHYTLLKDPSLACRVFKKELLSNVILFNQNIGIDEILIVQALVKAKKIVFVDKVYYYTYDRPDSVSRINYTEKKIKQGIRIYQFICEFMKKKKPEFTKYLEVKYLTYLMPVYELSIKLEEVKEKEIMKILENDIKHYYKISKNNKVYSQLPLLFRLKIRSLSTSKTSFKALLKVIVIRRSLIKS